MSNSQLARIGEKKIFYELDVYHVQQESNVFQEAKMAQEAEKK